jgi:hypothetical protein
VLGAADPAERFPAAPGRAPAYCLERFKCAAACGLWEAGAGGAAAKDKIRVWFWADSWVEVSPRERSERLRFKEVFVDAAREGIAISVDVFREGMKRSS